MLRPKDRKRAAELASALKIYAQKHHALPGISSPKHEEVLIQQLLESIHRVQYVPLIKRRPISATRADSHSDAFDPLKAAILKFDAGAFDEAVWLVFIFVHFGKSAKTGWRLARDVYGALGGQPWTWARLSAAPQSFQSWLASNQSTLDGGDGVERQFGPHRHYQSRSATKATGTGAAFQTYVEWVGPTRTHRTRFDQALADAKGSAHAAFDILYRSMRAVTSFGRLARFDYLTMLGKLDFLPISPGSTYMTNATGPVRGARLLFGDKNNKLGARELESRLADLDGIAKVGMQALEDGLCNWQKSPAKFTPFRG